MSKELALRSRSKEGNEPPFEFLGSGTSNGSRAKSDPGRPLDGRPTAGVPDEKPVSPGQSRRPSERVGRGGLERPTSARRLGTGFTNRARRKTVAMARFPGSRSRGSAVESATRIGASRRPSVPIAPARTLRELTGSRSSARTSGTLTIGTVGRPRRRRSRSTARPPLSVSRETTRTSTPGSSEPPNGFSSGTTRHFRDG